MYKNELVEDTPDAFAAFYANKIAKVPEEIMLAASICSIFYLFIYLSLFYLFFDYPRNKCNTFGL